MVGNCSLSESVNKAGPSPTQPKPKASPASAPTGGSTASEKKAGPAYTIAPLGRATVHDRPPIKTEEAIVALRVRQRRGQDWIGPELGVPARTVSRVLRRRAVPYLRDCDPLTGEMIRSSKTTAVRYERDRPGELVHVDVKKIGKIPDGGGWKAHGRQMGSSWVKKRARIGYDYVHSMVDDHSRLAYSEILPDEKGATCAGFILRASEHFAGHGITRIERVITDNHFSYRHSADVAAAISALDARHKFIKPHCPWQNGKVERFNRTLQTEWAYRQVFLDCQSVVTDSRKDEEVPVGAV